jgi:hypothetical protein
MSLYSLLFILLSDSPTAPVILHYKRKKKSLRDDHTHLRSHGKKTGPLPIATARPYPMATTLYVCVTNVHVK